MEIVVVHTRLEKLMETRKLGINEYFCEVMTCIDKYLFQALKG